MQALWFTYEHTTLHGFALHLFIAGMLQIELGVEFCLTRACAHCGSWQLNTMRLYIPIILWFHVPH